MDPFTRTRIECSLEDPPEATDDKDKWRERERERGRERESQGNPYSQHDDDDDDILRKTCPQLYNFKSPVIIIPNKIPNKRF